jgi:hypothetical protein
MRPGPRSVAEVIEEGFRLDDPPFPLDDVVAKIIGENPDWKCDPLDKAAVWTPEVQQLLQAHQNEMLRQSKQPLFAFNSSSSYMIQGACFEEPCDSPEVRQQKRNRLHWRSYHATLRSLNPRQFEVLCSRVLGLLGTPNPQVTPYQGDQGIDFYGQLSFGDLVGHGPVFPVLESRLTVWLIGQAKHYLHTKVATPDIRELVGATALGRAGVFSQTGIYPDLSIRTCDPVIMLFFTTGKISADGWRLCDRAGVVAMDGEMLAAFLADKGIAVQDGDRVFDASQFHTWLSV